MKHWKIGLLLIFLFVGVLYWRQEEEVFIEVGDSAVIVPASLAFTPVQLRESDIEEFWTPEPAQVVTLAAELPTFLGQNQRRFKRTRPWRSMNGYKAGILSFVSGGQQLIYGSFFCEVYNDKWKHYDYFMFDGGDCYFQVVYNPESHSFEDLWVSSSLN